MKTNTLKNLKSSVEYHADVVTKLKNGNYIFRRGFFYRNGSSAETFKDDIVGLLKSKFSGVFEVVEFKETWKAFSGRSSVANSSHWSVEIKVL